jgi:hypothetical protein
LRLSDGEDTVRAFCGRDGVAVLALDGAFEPVQKVGAVLDRSERLCEWLSELQGTDGGKVVFILLDEVSPSTDQPTSFAVRPGLVGLECFCCCFEGFASVVAAEVCDVTYLFVVFWVCIGYQR